MMNEVKNDKQQIFDMMDYSLHTGDPNMSLPHVLDVAARVVEMNPDKYADQLETFVTYCSGIEQADAFEKLTDANKEYIRSMVKYLGEMVKTNQYTNEESKGRVA